MAKVTARLLAAHTGVSLAAVSRAFQPGSSLSDDKRKRVLEAAAKLGYKTPSGRTLSRIATGTISLVAGDLTNPFYPVVLEESSQRLHERCRKLVLHAIPPGGAIDLVMQQVIDYRADAAIVTSATMTSQWPALAGGRTCRSGVVRGIAGWRIPPPFKHLEGARTCGDRDSSLQTAAEPLHIAAFALSQPVPLTRPTSPLPLTEPDELLQTSHAPEAQHEPLSSPARNGQRPMRHRSAAAPRETM